MLKANRRFAVLVNILFEIGLIEAAYYSALFIRFKLLHGLVSLDVMTGGFTLLILAYSIITVFVYYLLHLYRPEQKSRLSREIICVLIINSVGIVSLTASFYVVRIEDFSRMALAFFWALSSLFIIAKRVIWHFIIRSRVKRGIGLKKIVLVGSGRLACRYTENVRDNPQLGYDIVGYVSNVICDGLGDCLGGLEDLETLLEKYEPDEVVIALEPHETAYIRYVLSVAEKEGVHISMIPFYSDYFPSHPTIETIGSSKLINLRATPLDSTINSTVKRAADIVGSLLAIVLLSPLMIFTAIGVKLSSPGPVLFRQKRVGRGKKQFTMLKFRSMRINEEEETGWSTDGDSRRTKFGSFIRKYSIDELPQFFNVLVGNMSLVGPRPEVPFYVYRFKESVPLYLVRQQVRPGITGWAQVHGLRGDTSIEERVEYDIWYIENWSIGLDIRILLKTVFGGFINSEIITVEQVDEAHV